MTNKEIAESLKELVKLYSDSTWNYERALDQIQDEDLRKDLVELHDEHLEHMDNLNNYIKQLGERIPQYEYTGEMSAELTTITNDMSDEEIINSLRKNEKVLSEKLENIVEDIQIPEIAHDLEEDIDDENIYIDTLKDYLD
ncbi:MAG: ferritin-like domain-containing protein [Fibrobacter sp.]|nr:ferritin-like domain-containing protein [Fibrobacter sp.]